MLTTALRKLPKQRKYIIFEDRLKRFQLFSSEGSQTRNIPAILEAFCHFVFHITGGTLAITNLQGNKTGHTYNLTNPTLLSFSGDETDIQRVLNHRCNSICQRYTSSGCQRMGGISMAVIPSAPPLEDVTHRTYQSSWQDPPPPYEDPPPYSEIDSFHHSVRSCHELT